MDPRHVRDLLARAPLMARELPAFGAGADPGAAPATPTELFAAWLAEAVEAGVLDPGAALLSTAGSDGRPDARIVALRDVEPVESAWVFATDAASPKGVQLAQRPAAALTFYWPLQGRQIRVRGDVTQAPRDVSLADFASRSPASKVAGLVGRQSTPMGALPEWNEAAERAGRELAEHPDAHPPGHTVYALAAHHVEFWQGDAHRRHVRLAYAQLPDADWERALLWP
ncbi:Pyridoxamine 5'-phosphate oxidase [Streptomyces zhaozhouensis]|uniref:Pyridoxamine 5'-phosphate oxidase n=1 Tax=Streptomyces zhaozhouensis TaxID=1300267 RepID=A0A286E6W9_9ACTN|nr:pyridoxal 5'-phosphate synthase [Streptomyces zhaozhouensis]SOD66655.1 Pyridoxamine 5'-phosphate oxidase [Streptomyces zhaozhouensis]